MMLDWRIYQGAFRDPTMMDVEEQARKIGAEFWKESLVYAGGSHRRYMLRRAGVSAPVVLQECVPGERPDWGMMLKTMEADWIL
ncbi:hypothetical protein RPALISO_223 [Ruegeria phage RpAliso]|nr:hypothetical protein RPALISO_223 [Ruegeria phage RpAliso]